LKAQERDGDGDPTYFEGWIPLKSSTDWKLQALTHV
tara:strand:- start:1523 stop:1630 length:108 start_codon:yes stop_codon:yes gene_type:complete